MLLQSGISSLYPYAGLFLGAFALLVTVAALCSMPQCGRCHSRDVGENMDLSGNRIRHCRDCGFSWR